MIKGINHQVIEVCDTDNRYYERAFLVLRPEYASVTREILEKEARKLISKMGTVSSANKKSVIFSKVFNACLFVAIGALTTAIIYTVF